jgi:hypothetical protein
MKTITKLLLTIFVLLHTFHTHAANRPDDAVKQFYDWRLKTQFTGVPEEATLKKAKRFLSPELVCLLDRARVYRNSFAKKFPTDKPPFIEGDLFTSMFEGANRYVLEKVRTKDGKATAQMHFYHDQTPKVDKKGWCDTVLLKEKNQHWYITDIQYRGKFEFGNSGSLRKNLRDELSKDNKELNWQAKTELKLCR